MTLGIKVEIRNAGLNLIRDAIDGGAGAGKLKFYNGTRPATGGAATTLLGTVVCSDPSAPDAATGVLTFSAFTEDSNAAAEGVSTWARLTDSDDAFVADVNVGKIITQNGNTTSGSAVISGLTNTSKMDVGMQVSGTGIPVGAEIESVDSATQITLTDNATATSTGVAITVETPDADILLNDNNISAGGIIRVTSGTITAGNA
jgi:hypothetical protein